MKKSNKFSPEVRERAVRMVQEHRGEYPSLWAAIESIAPKIGCVPQTLNEWVKRVEVDTGVRDGVTTAEAQRVGVAGSRSRPAVSNDNPYSEALFRTLKYRPQMPVKPFGGLLQARRWVTQLVHWYNHEHRHSAIGFVTPAQRHMQADQALLNARAKVYAAARDANPNRWSGQARNWSRITQVHLNPETQKKQNQPTQLAA